MSQEEAKSQKIYQALGLIFGEGIQDCSTQVLILVHNYT